MRSVAASEICFMGDLDTLMSVSSTFRDDPVQLSTVQNNGHAHHGKKRRDLRPHSGGIARRHVIEDLRRPAEAVTGGPVGTQPPGGFLIPRNSRISCPYVRSNEGAQDGQPESSPRRVESGAFCFGARARRHGFRNVSDQVARVLVLNTPNCGLEASNAARGKIPRSLLQPRAAAEAPRLALLKVG
jgi:hypothetical protein